MVSTKAVESTVSAIESKLKTFGGDMVKIEFLENCLKQLGLPNDAKRFCYLKLADLYAYKLMWPQCAKAMDAAAETAVTYKDKIAYYQKEISYLLKISDYLMIDKAFKKAMLCAVSPLEKQAVKDALKKEMLTLAADYEKKNKRSNASQIYEKLIEMPITSDQEKKDLMAKTAALNAKLGRLKEAMRYEQMMKRPIEHKRSNDPDEEVRKVTFDDLGISWTR